jgi:hypothetical protein
MTTIKIQQRPNELQKATLSFSQGSNYPIEIKPPFDVQQEQNLEWYFEEHLTFPFTDQVKFPIKGAVLLILSRFQTS